MKYRYQSLPLKKTLSGYTLIPLLFSMLLISPYGFTKEMKEKSIQYSHILELSHPIKESIPLWPGDPEVSFKSVATMSKDGYYLRQFTIGEHSATHMNAPNSFVDNGQGIDSFPASSLVLPAIVINVKAAVKNNPDYIISMKDIQSWEKSERTNTSRNISFF
ncbi:Kynurenine formamidase [Vibrio aerogenes CECT 7868]|uniref:Kynurenine formamidase n=1 Tax=Vibrio aerogenes CECT 7868 TaxID=1216006 RepID=A0A1M5ZMR1_9VIBR|nr:cyclase family protein [Vibrio aerogenes]SHI25426.1 Kynurenine formamidase [Vibrio aerogenes CECT 7868]